MPSTPYRSALVAVTALVVLAGCSSFVGPSVQTGEQPGEPTTTTDRQSPTTTAPPSTAASCYGAGRLEIQTFYDGRLDVRLVNLSDGHTITRTYTERSGVYDFSPLMTTDDYRVVLTTNGTEAWNRTVRCVEGYTLRVGQNGNVSVLSRGIV